MNYPVRKIHRKERFIVEFTAQEQGTVIATTDLMETTRPVGYFSDSWRTCLDTSLWEDVLLACKTCGKETLLYTNGYCSQACQDKALKNSLSNKEHTLKPSHYKPGRDSFAWAEEKYDLDTCLAIAAFNIHKYNDREKDQDYNDFGKITVYADWARRMMKKNNES